MRLANRLGLERRVAAAEEAIRRRVMSRTVELLADEYRAGDWTTQRNIEATMAMLAAGEIDGAERDPVGAVLGELAKSAPEIAARIGRAVGVTVPVPTASVSAALISDK